MKFWVMFFCQVWLPFWQLGWVVKKLLESIQTEWCWVGVVNGGWPGCWGLNFLNVLLTVIDQGDAKDWQAAQLVSGGQGAHSCSCCLTSCSMIFEVRPDNCTRSLHMKCSASPIIPLPESGGARAAESCSDPQHSSSISVVIWAFAAMVASEVKSTFRIFFFFVGRRPNKEMVSQDDVQPEEEQPVTLWMWTELTAS